MTHYFVVCTPFQGYVVCKMSKKLDRQKTCFINTTGDSIFTDTTSNLVKELILNHHLRDLFTLWTIRSRILREIKSKKDIHFYIPHVQTLVSSFFYRLALKHQNIRIHVYYEGIAILYNPIVKITRRDLFRRKLLGLISGFYYNHCPWLFPNQLREIATAHSPFPKFTSRFLEIKELRFDFLIKNNHLEPMVLILGSPLKTNVDLITQLKQIDIILQKIGTQNILFKPHYSVIPHLALQFSQNLKQRSLNILELESNKSIEALMNTLNVESIYAMHPTSALLNISLMYGEQVKLYSFKSDSSKPWVLEEVFSELGVQFIA